MDIRINPVHLPKLLKKIKMKKITLLAVAFVAISFASCKKDRTCSCTTTVSGNGSSSSDSDSWTIVKEKKGTAKAACVSTKQVEGGITSERKCTLS